MKQYSSYLTTRYGMCCVVFDGYEEHSIKDHEYRRRQKGKISATIVISENAKAHKDQQAFFANHQNKTQFISLLAKHLEVIGHCVKVSTSDADTMIVSSALECARKGQAAIVVAEVTDVFLMLLYHWEDSLADIFIKNEGKHNRPGQMFSMKEANTSIPVVIQKYILFIHAWSGCDTTSATFGHGKLHLMKMLKESPEVQTCAKKISEHESSAKEVGEAGHQLFCILYGGTKQDTLTSLQYARYMTMMAKSKRVEPHRLPPTEHAAYYHSLRVHLQVVNWINLTNDNLEIRKWGWTMENGSLCPIMTDLDAAPPKVLHFIRCKCKSTGRNPCGSNQCSCRKFGFKCSMACEECRGQSFNNTGFLVALDDEYMMWLWMFEALDRKIHV